MTTRTRAMAIDPGTSLEADAVATPATLTRVRAQIVTLLREYGPLTDEQLVEHYLARAGSHPAVPRVTPQRIRTARSALVRAGHVTEVEGLAFSSLGNRASLWGIA